MNSQLVTDLFQAARNCSSRFPLYALQQVCGSLQADGGMTAIVRLPDRESTAKQPLLLNPYVYLPNHRYSGCEIARDWLQIEPQNPLQRDCFKNRGVSVRATMDKLPDGEWKQIVLKHNLSCMLATVEGTRSRSFRLVVLWRRDPATPFNQTDQVMKNQLMPILMECFDIHHEHKFVRSIRDTFGENLCYAQAFPDGMRLQLDADIRFIDLLHAEWPDWHNSWLPGDLHKEMMNGNPGPYVGNKAIISWRFDGDAFQLTGNRLGRLEELTPREREVIVTYANGLKQGEVGRQMSRPIRPETVRNHISKAYEKLGINNRSDVIKLLSPFLDHHRLH